MPYLTQKLKLQIIKVIFTQTYKYYPHKSIIWYSKKVIHKTEFNVMLIHVSEQLHKLLMRFMHSCTIEALSG